MEQNVLALRYSLVKIPEKERSRWFDNSGFQKKSSKTTIL